MRSDSPARMTYSESGGSRFLRSATVRATGLFAGVLILVMVALLVGRPMSPERAKELCVINMTLPAPFRLLLNCDVTEFLRMAHEPSTLLEPENSRQSRPVFILAGAAAGLLFTPVAMLLQPLVPADPGPTWRKVDKVQFGLQAYLPVYLGYLALNVGALLGAFVLACRSARLPATMQDYGLVVFACIGTLMVSNDVVKAFVWSPHTQMFNILFPVGGLWMILRNRILGPSELLLASVAIGVGMLAYGAAGMLLVCLWAGQAWALHKAGRPPLTRRLLALAAVSLVLCAIPPVAWYLFVTFSIGSFELIETRKYNQIVWIAQAASEGFGTLASTVARKTWFFTSQMLRQALPVLFALAAITAWVLGQSRTKRAWLQEMREPAAAAVGVCALFVAFYTFIGYQDERLAYAGVGPLIVLACIAVHRAEPHLDGGWPRAAAWAAGGFAAACAAFTVLKDGPYS